MPKLASKDAAAVEEAVATGGGFELLPSGKYYAQLESVENKTSSSNSPGWNATFNNLHTMDGEHASGKQFLYMNLPTSDTPPANYAKGPDKWKQFQDLSRGRLKQFFEAFGYSTDSDTDELLTEWCILTVGVQTIQSGPKQGEKGNVVNKMEPVPDDFEPPVGTANDEDNF